MGEDYKLIEADTFKKIDDLASNLSVELIITSPPYYNAKNYGDNFKGWNSYEEYLEDMRFWIKKSLSLLKPGRILCINSSPIIEPRKSRSHRSKRRNIPGDLHNICKDLGFWFLEDITWSKPEGSAVNRNQRFSVDRNPLQWKANPVTESILVYQKPTDKLNGEIIAEYDGGKVKGQYARSDLWHITPDNKNEHPASFPVEIPKRLIRYYSWPGDLVFDPFMGIGSTAVASVALDRNLIGIEINSKYIEKAKSRIDQNRSLNHNFW